MEATSKPLAQTNGKDIQTESNSQDANGIQKQVPEISVSAQPGVPAQGNGMQVQDQSISADEIALYDRQIRLWGVKAQEKIRTANVLLIGLKGLGNEVAKNLVLAGIGSLTVVDDMPVTEDDLGAQFLIRQEHVGMIRSQAALPEIQKLNPRVTVAPMTLASLFADTSMFGAFTIVIATDMSLADSSTINVACRMMGRPMYAAGTYGMYGYIFADLISHEFVISREKSNISTKIGPESSTREIVSATTSKGSDGKITELVTKRETYTPLLLANTSPLPPFHLSSRRRKANVTPVLSCLRALWEYQDQTNKPHPTHTHDDLALFTKIATAKHQELQLPSETLGSSILRSFLQSVGSELSPVCAFLGGQLAQDVINVVGAKEQPIQNMLIFDGEDTKGPVYAFKSEVTLPYTASSVPLPPMPEIPVAIDTNGLPVHLPMDPSLMSVPLPANMGMMPPVDPTAVAFQSMPIITGMMDAGMPGVISQMPQQSGNLQAGAVPTPASLPAPGPTSAPAPAANNQQQNNDR